jgi:DNA (cytosine-5)-methyltransferase 1
MTLKVADFFCGTGGFSNGFVQTGEFEVVLGLDIKQASVDTFSTNEPAAIAICEDIRKVKIQQVAEQLGKTRNALDVIIGGPPCQGFSSLRPYRSINEDDRRNNLFEQFALFVDFFKPKFVVFENVVGLQHHKDGQTLASITAALEGMGYTTDRAILTAVHYGVPQKRERLIVLARKGKIKPSLPMPRYRYNGRSMGGPLALRTVPLFDRDLPEAVTVGEAISDLPPIEAGEKATEYSTDVVPTDYARARRKKCQVLSLHGATRHTPRMLEIVRKAGANRWALPEGLTTSGFSTCYSRLTADEPSTTLTVNFVHPASNRCIHPTQHRALTPREGARIQSFDDDFIFCGTRTEIVKQIGEAVPPLLGKAIAEAVLQQM